MKVIDMPSKQSFTRENAIKIAVIAVAIILLGSLVAFFLTRGGEEEDKGYNPENELPQGFMMIVDYPTTHEEQFAISNLASVQFMGGEYHPLVICDREGGLSSQEIYTLTNLDTDRPKILFTNQETAAGNVNRQLSDAGLSVINDTDVYPLCTQVAGTFIGFNDILTVEDYEESLWVAAYAKNMGLGVVEGERTFTSQESVWNTLKNIGVEADYAIVSNPLDHSLESISATPEYDHYDDAWFCPDLSLMAAQMSAYHDAYVITNSTPRDSTDWNINLEYSQNRRALGIHENLKKINFDYGALEYIALTGSASAIPQFLVNPEEGSSEIVNSDVLYGFLDNDNSAMDSAVGRVIQYDVSLASNQLLKTYLVDDFTDKISVDYRDVAGGTQEKDWRTHGASFSGYDITYKRMQATPARWICTDFEDQGFTYDYVGPFNTGNKFLDGTVNSMENDISEICEGAGYVAYRGHGSDTGSLYGIRVMGPNGEEHALRYTDCNEMNVPPQIAFFVSCLNGKIYGHGPGTDPANDVAFDKLFTLNYLASGPAVLIGATEVSFSNIGQDIWSLRAEYGPLEDDYKWDHNDAWYAWVWDGILNHPGEHGAAGKAVQWAENRYMKYPANNNPSPMIPTGEVDWYEVTFFACYGDPAFRPAIDPNGGAGSYDPWHNGPDDM